MAEKKTQSWNCRCSPPGSDKYPCPGSKYCGTLCLRVQWRGKMSEGAIETRIKDTIAFGYDPGMADPVTPLAGSRIPPGFSKIGDHTTT